MIRNREQHIEFIEYKSRKSGRFIAMLAAKDGYRGKTAMGIRVGASEKSVGEKYPYPHKKIGSTTEAFRIYADLGLGFEMRDGTVRSWFLFEAK